MIISFKGFTPVIDPSSYVHPQATVTGNVIIGKNVYIGPGAAIRGDWGEIQIKDGCNVQENCTIHMFPGVTVVLEEDAHVGHGAVVHGSHIGRNCLIGMNSVVMDNVVLEEECIVGALTFIKADSHFERRSLIVGNPGKKIKTISDKMIEWKSKGTALYQTLPKDMKDNSSETAPLDEMPESRPEQKSLYNTWNEIKSKPEE